MPGIGVRTGARILIDVGDGSSFPTAAHLAAYAGLAPTTRSSGSSIRGEQPSRRGNKQLKRALFLSAFAALADPVSPTYYDKKISQGKHHTQALLCLARRRADVLFAMLRDGATAPSTTPNPALRVDETQRGTPFLRGVSCGASGGAGQGAASTVMRSAPASLSVSASMVPRISRSSEAESPSR